MANHRNPLLIRSRESELVSPRKSLIPRLHDDGTVRNGSAWHGTERLSSNVYTCLWLCGIEWFLKSNSVINYNHCQKSKWMPCLQRSVQSRKGGIRCTKEGERLFSRNIRNIMAMAIQYTSNGLSNRSCCTPIDFFPQFSSCTCIDSSPQIFITRLFRPIHHFNTMETSSTHAQLLSYPDLPQSSRAVPGSPVIATVLARHGFDRVYT